MILEFQNLEKDELTVVPKRQMRDFMEVRSGN